jgi:(1->4)-alpha-D-glucan 1-alpha-D-glucosylmutase
MPRLKAPLATYRLQFNKDFRFADATRLLDYLCQLGITDLYASPILVSREGSGHGYDVTDPSRIDPEIGSEEEFELLQSELVKRDMGLLLDIVPNHMAASSENRWWMDVLENGRDSAFAAYFDIDWQPGSRHLTGKVLLPFLGRPFGEALDNGELQLAFRGGKFYACYFDSVFPIAPESYYQILSGDHRTLDQQLAKERPSLQELAGILAGFAMVAQKTDGVTATERRLKVDALRERLRVLATDHIEVRSFLDARLRQFNGVAGHPGSFSLLEHLLSQQHYLLAYWQDPNEGINYRRFFAITDLVGVRAEDPIVFEATHGQLIHLVAKGAKQGLRTGLRIDHIDGLLDPSGYLSRLQHALAEVPPPRVPQPDAPPLDALKTYLVVEKILAPGERLPEDWPVAGTTGYDFMNYLQGPFVHSAGARKIDAIYRQFVGNVPDFVALVHEKKKLVMNSLLRVEMRGLTRQLAELASKDRYARNISWSHLHDALTETTACMPVYRTYIRSLDVPPQTREVIVRALSAAQTRRPQLAWTCLEFLRDVLTLANPPHIVPGQLEERLAFVMRWQQFTGPIAAKGFEDTALYAYYPLSSLNEVGGDPEPARAVSRAEFYEYLGERHRRWPLALNATTTHDTKRSEDLRARVSVLSEIPDEWNFKLLEWSKLNTRHKSSLNGHYAPDANEEYLIYQTLLGIWPVETEDSTSITKRLQRYMTKALREATIHTRWAKPNEAHEQAVSRFVQLLLAGESSAKFLADFTIFQRKIAWCGMIYGLAQLLLKIASPGTPDFYQGSELWDLRLVDPDNREPVDFRNRCEFLKALAEPTPDNCFHLLRHWPDGQVKMHVAQQALQYRLLHPELFTHGGFSPVRTLGVREEHVIPILRHDNSDQVMVIVPRWIAQTYTAQEAPPSKQFWGETSLVLSPPAPASWINVLTGERVQTRVSGESPTLAVAEVLQSFPVALLSQC